MPWMETSPMLPVILLPIFPVAHSFDQGTPRQAFAANSRLGAPERALANVVAARRHELRHHDDRHSRPSTDIVADIPESLSLLRPDGSAVDHQQCSITVSQGKHRLSDPLCQLAGVPAIPKALHFNANRATWVFDHDVNAVIATKRPHVRAALFRAKRLPI